MDRRSWILIFVVGAIWGASFLFIEIGIRDMSPSVVAWARVALGAAFLVPFAWYRGVLRVPGAGVGLIVFLAATQVAVPFVLIGEGQKDITSSLSGILVASTPLWTALLAIRLDPSRALGGQSSSGESSPGSLGVGLLLGVDLRGTSAEIIGGTLVLLASLGYAIGGLVTKLKLPGAPGAGVAAWITAHGNDPAHAVRDRRPPVEAPGIGPTAAVVALGVVGTGVAFAIFFELMTTIGPARTFTVTYLSPGFAVVYGAVLLDEPIGVSDDRRARADPRRLVPRGRLHPLAQRIRDAVALGVALGPRALGESVERRDHPVGAQLLAPLERAAGVVEAELHRGVDVIRFGDSLLDREARLVHQAAHDALEDGPVGRLAG